MYGPLLTAGDINAHSFMWKSWHNTHKREYWQHGALVEDYIIDLGLSVLKNDQFQGFLWLQLSEKRIPTNNSMQALQKLHSGYTKSFQIQSTHWMCYDRF